MSSWLSKAVGVNSLNHDFNYEPAMASVPGMNFGNISNQMLSGEGSFFDTQRSHAASQLQDAAYNAMHQQNMALAQRGVGRGGLRSLLDATSNARVGEQLSEFNVNLAGQGFQQASNFANLGLQQAQMNQAAKNQATEYAITSSYNQAAANRAAKGQFFGNMITLATGLPPGVFGGGGENNEEGKP